ncbi:MAG TPA: pitrilysin family protein [Armatimonadota bacterium]|nr:pitrilysin family protein [Armatimonadota bacterium]
MVATSVAPSQAAAPAPRQWTLPNGLRVVLQDNQPTATVVVCGFVRVTALHETRVGPGIRRLTNMMVGRADSCQELVRSAGARVETALAPDYAEVVISGPTESVGDCARILRQALYGPELTERALEIERARLLRQFAARAELPAEYATDLAYSRLYPGLGSATYVLGDPVVVAGLTLEQVRRFHGAHYLPNATVVSISGGVASEATRSVVSQVLGGLLPGGMPEQAPMARANGRLERIEVQWPGATAALCVASPAVSLDSPDYPAAATAMVLLSSGSGSRLYQKLRHERGLCYSISGDITPSAVTPMATVLLTAAQGDIAEVERIVGDEMDRLGAEEPDPAELRRAKRYLAGQHAMRHQRNREIAHYLGVFELLGGAPGYRLDSLLAGRLAVVSGAQVRSVAAEMLRGRVVVVLSESGGRR